MYGKYSALNMFKEISMTNAYGGRDDLIDLFAGKLVEVETDGFTNDMTTPCRRDGVLTLLIHLGYLTTSYKDREKYVKIPKRK